MAIQIGNQGVVTASTRITVDSAKPYFNFTFNQEYPNPNITITSIDGFTSDPAFTPTSNAFTFNSTGSPTGTIAFSFTATSGNITTTVTTDLIQNGVLLETLSNDVSGGHTFDFTPIIVGIGDTIQIRTYFAD
jgi:hypothetical protein